MRHGRGQSNQLVARCAVLAVVLWLWVGVRLPFLTEIGRGGDGALSIRFCLGCTLISFVPPKLGHKLFLRGPAAWFTDFGVMEEL